MRNSQLKKEARMKTLNEISLDPKLSSFVNTRALVEEKLRSGAEMEDHEIAVIMDVKNYGNKEVTAYAHKGIQEIISGETADLYYGATTLFLEIIYDYARNYRTKIGNAKYLKLMDYMQAHAAIVKENVERKAQTDATALKTSAMANGTALPGAGAPALNPAVPTVQAQPQNDATAAVSSAQNSMQNNAAVQQ